jgi:hypothetical protein
VQKPTELAGGEHLGEIVHPATSAVTEQSRVARSPEREPTSFVTLDSTGCEARRDASVTCGPFGPFSPDAG